MESLPPTEVDRIAQDARKEEEKKEEKDRWDINK